MATKLQK